MGLGTRLKHAWNAFNGGDPHRYYLQNLGFSSSVKPDTKPLSFGNDRTIISSIYSRMAIDVAALKFRHVRIDSEGNYVDEIQSTLNYCLKDRANKDQTARAFIQDCAYSLFDEGCIAIVPTTANKSPIISDSYNIGSLRVGKILEWWPDMVRVQVYNEDKGERKELILPKKMVAIVQNPLYSVMNEPNSILKRLLSALRQMDAVDEQLSSGKLDMIIQLPYVVKNRTQADEAEKRRKNLEVQLASSKIGIGYIDGTEKIVQLNRPLENNILSKTEYLTSMLFGQLGISENVFKGTGTEEEQLYYFNSAIEPVAAAIADGMRTIFLTKTARSQGQSIMFFRDNFKLVSVTNLAESADKFIRNEILSANEFRSILGRKPSSNPKSDELRNPNMPQEDQPAEPGMEETDMEEDLTEEDFNQAFAELDLFDEELDEIEASIDLQHYASPYYDPVKAHEYYMRTRELKGRRSTASLNDEGKNAARYVREQLNNERKAKVEASKNTMRSNIANTNKAASKYMTTAREKKKAQIAAHSERMKSDIKRLRDSLKGMSSEDKVRNRERINSEIQSLRDANSKQREQLNAEYKRLSESTKAQKSAKNQSYRDTHAANVKQYKQEYEDSYDAELAKIKADKGFQKQKKSRSKKG